jgi:hypothetical protein
MATTYIDMATLEFFEVPSKKDLSFPKNIKRAAFIFNDGGRAASGYKGMTGDCVVRAIAIATEQPYQVVYDALKELAKSERITKRQQTKSSVRNGTRRSTVKRYMNALSGWKWVSCMSIGSGCKVHLRADELPTTGRLVLSLSKHMAAWVDGQLHDTYDCSRDGTRCVYGYWIKE